MILSYSKFNLNETINRQYDDAIANFLEEKLLDELKSKSETQIINTFKKLLKSKNEFKIKIIISYLDILSSRDVVLDKCLKSIIAYNDVSDKHQIISALSSNLPEIYKKAEMIGTEEDKFKTQINKDLGDLGF